MVDEEEMIAVLWTRPDLYALLDVTWPEPAPSSSPLYDLPNVLLTPHIAGALGNECRRLGSMAVDEFERYRRGEPLLGQVREEMMARSPEDGLDSFSLLLGPKSSTGKEAREGAG